IRLPGELHRSEPFLLQVIYIVPGAVEHRASASDVGMRPLPVCSVSIARMQLFHHACLKQLHSASALGPCPRGNTLARFRLFVGEFMTSHIGRTKEVDIDLPWATGPQMQ